MSHPTVLVLIGLIAWALFLMIVMEILRVQLVVTRRIAANEFRTDNSNLSPFMQRLARAQANCVENLPIFGGILLVALITGQTAVTDPLAYALFAARLVQSCVHLFSVSVLAVNARFLAFAVQLVIATVWVIRLLPS